MLKNTVIWWITKLWHKGKAEVCFGQNILQVATVLGKNYFK
jgi:hypothetical protein